MSHSITLELDRPIVGIDVDGVLLDILPPWCRLYNRDWNDKLVPEQVTDWNMASFVKEECGKQVYRYLGTTELYDRMDAVAGAAEGVQAIRDMGAQVLFITTSQDGQGDAKREALRRLGFLPPASEDPFASELCQFPHKHLLPISLMIDDYIGNLEPLQVPGILFPAPYNEQFRDNGRFPRAERGWADVVPMVEEMLALERAVPTQRTR